MFTLNSLIVISISCLAAVNSKLIMDDIDVEANPDYLSVNHSIDRSNEHEIEPIANIQIDLKKDITDLKVRVALNAEIGGKLNEIYPSKDYNPCKDDVEDELVKYALDSLEKYGNLKIQCPLKQGHYYIENFKLGDNNSNGDSLQSLKLGRFRVDIEAFSIEDSIDVKFMSLKFSFHGE